jgi:hypothetical protein
VEAWWVGQVWVPHCHGGVQCTVIVGLHYARQNTQSTPGAIVVIRAGAASGVCRLPGSSGCALRALRANNDKRDESFAPASGSCLFLHDRNSGASRGSPLSSLSS